MAVAKSLNSMQTMRWSEKEYTLEELVANYRSLLPFPVLVTSGCWIAPDYSVYWVRDAIDCSWIVVQTEDDSRYKVPQCYDAEVIPIKADGSEGMPFPFQDVREHGNYQYIRFVDPVHQVQIDISGENSLMNLGNMKVVDVYDEVFLAVHPLHIEELVSGSSGSSQTNKSVITKKLHFIPSSMPVTVSPGIALVLVPDFVYFHTMAEIKALADSYQLSCVDQMKEQLVILEETLVPSTGDYVEVCVGATKMNDKRKLENTSRRKYPVGKGIDLMKRLSQLRHFFETEEYDACDIGEKEEAVCSQQHAKDLKNVVPPRWPKQPPPVPPPKPCRKSYASSPPPSGPPVPSQECCWSGRISAAAIPDDIADLTVEELADCLNMLNLSQYAPAFIEHMVDGQLLLSMKVDHLMSTFGFTELDAHKMMRFAHRGWRPTT